MNACLIGPKCNPSSVLGQSCERCRKRKMKCEYLTRQEQQLQATPEWDQPHLDPCAVTLQHPYAPASAQIGPSLRHTAPTASMGCPRYNSIATNAVPGSVLMSGGSWSNASAPQQPGVSGSYGAGAPRPSPMRVDPNQQVMGYTSGHLLQVPPHAASQGSSSAWYPTTDQQ